MSKVEAQAMYNDIAEACKESEMRQCPNKTEYLAIDPATTDPDEITKRKLWKGNAKLMATIVIGQQSDHGMVMVKKTKCADFPSRLAWKVLEVMQK